mgnify:CR=1 FL=1
MIFFDQTVKVFSSACFLMFFTGSFLFYLKNGSKNFQCWSLSLDHHQRASKILLFHPGLDGYTNMDHDIIRDIRLHCMTLLSKDLIPSYSFRMDTFHSSQEATMHHTCQHVYISVHMVFLRKEIVDYRVL